VGLLASASSLRVALGSVSVLAVALAIGARFAPVTEPAEGASPVH